MNRTIAIFKKQLKDTLKNKMILVQFVLFPFIAFVFTEFVAKSNADLPDTYFVTLFATMYAGMVPLINMANIIAEEREKKSLQMLIMSNVKPYEYLLGVGSYVLILCSLGGVAFGLIGGYSGTELLRFVLTIILGVIASILLGSAVGIFSKNQGAATAVAMPLALITAFVPMVAMFNDKIASLANILYTQQINTLINNLSASNFTANHFFAIGANMLVFLMVFTYAYVKVDLKE